MASSCAGRRVADGAAIKRWSNATRASWSACKHSLKVPHYCSHRSCSHCQHHDSQRWIELQQAKLLPVEYILITFTVPAELRSLFWSQQRISYDMLLKTAWQPRAH